MDEVVGIPVRDLGKRPFEEPADRVVLPVVIEDIGLVTALLQQEAAAGEVIRPGLRLVRPGLVPVHGGVVGE